jgi:hypothetical protein
VSSVVFALHSSHRSTFWGHCAHESVLTDLFLVARWPGNVSFDIWPRDHQADSDFILGISAWASTLDLMPLVNKAHTIADDAYILIGKANDKFSLVDLIEEQVNDIDKLVPTIQSTVMNIDSTARNSNIDSNMDEFMPRLDHSVEGIDTEVRNVHAIANITSALVENAALVLATFLDTTMQANATLVEVQAKARALDIMLREANLITTRRYRKSEPRNGRCRALASRPERRRASPARLVADSDVCEFS